MPRGDRTGPMGQGPVTGKGLGYCSGYESPGFAKGFGMGRGFGRGRSFGRGYGFSRGYGYGVPYTAYEQGFFPRSSYSKEDEIQILKEQAESLKRTQKDIEKRLSQLEKE